MKAPRSGFAAARLVVFALGGLIACGAGSDKPSFGDSNFVERAPWEATEENSVAVPPGYTPAWQVPQPSRVSDPIPEVDDLPVPGTTRAPALDHQLLPPRMRQQVRRPSNSSLQAHR